MAGGTIRAEAPFVWFIRAMTGDTILRCILEIGERSRIEMTFRAGCIDMLAGQLEREIMFEVLSKAIHPIVAVEAGIAIFKRMGQGEDGVHLTVAGLAGV